MTDIALVPTQTEALLQSATMLTLGIDPTQDPLAYQKVRTSWPGPPTWAITDDVCFVRAVPEDDEYDRVRDVEVRNIDGASLQTTTTYTRVWRIMWVVYGPNSFDHTRLIHSGLFQDNIHDLLAASNLYFIPDPNAPQRAPENYQGQWWERVNFSARFNELVTEVSTVPSIASAEVIPETAAGKVADLNLTKPF